ncbi:MAG TPA: hypothetical protein VL882_09015 [Vicinamibacterales bacterium]|jgi:hypothetical protein|nr:hypothetical protein [Vicinamibacterales bacterium]
MRYLPAIAAVVMLVTASDASAQRSRTSTRKPAPPAPPKIEPAQINCPEPLGVGVKTGASYCFVLAGNDPAGGVRVTMPPHVNTAALLFDLHNRHTYSDEDIRAGRGFAKYTAVVAVLSMKGDLLDRGAVQTEFRTARDLYERISGGAGPGGVKAVAPLGKEEIRISIPAAVNEVSILGEILDATTTAGRETATPGRTVAVISNVRVEYRPAPAKTTTKPVKK